MIHRNGKLTITVRIVSFLHNHPYSSVEQILRHLRKRYFKKAREDTVRSILHKGIESGRFVRMEADWNAKVRGRHLYVYANE